MKLLKLIASPVFVDSIRDYGYNKMSEQYQFVLDPVFGSLHSNTKWKIENCLNCYNVIKNRYTFSSVLYIKQWNLYMNRRKLIEVFVIYIALVAISSNHGSGKWIGKILCLTVGHLIELPFIRLRSLLLRFKLASMVYNNLILNNAYI